MGINTSKRGIVWDKGIVSDRADFRLGSKDAESESSHKNSGFAKSHDLFPFRAKESQVQITS